MMPPADMDEDVALIWAWLLCAARPFADDAGEYPILLLHGEQSTGKSQALKMLGGGAGPHAPDRLGHAARAARNLDFCQSAASSLLR
jgi:hypothetical protein